MHLSSCSAFYHQLACNVDLFRDFMFEFMFSDGGLLLKYVFYYYFYYYYCCYKSLILINVCNIAMIR